MKNRIDMEGASNKKNNVPPTGLSAKRAGKTVLATPPAGAPTLERMGMDAREASILNDLRKELDTLKEVAKRVKTEGVKDGIDKISTLLSQLVDLRSVIKTGGRQQVAAQMTEQGRNVLTKADASGVSDLTAPVLAEIRAINHRMAEQGEIIRTLASRAAYCSEEAALGNQPRLRTTEMRFEPDREVTGNDGSKNIAWTDVVKRRRKAKTLPNAMQAVRIDTQTRSADKPSIRARPPAIIVQVAPEKYSEMARKIRNETDLEGTGGRVVGMRQARRGGILIEVRGDGQQIEAVRAEVSKTAGQDAVVNTLNDKTLLEIRDLDEWTEAGEIQDAVIKATEREKEVITVISLRKQYNGTQSALVLLPSRAARPLLSDRLKVGMVYCRVRERERRVRCYRCLAFGHEGRTCGGADRSTCCRRCGGQEHIAKNCTASREEAEIFAKILKAESTRIGENNEPRTVDSQ